jgi:hypothetical protein
VVGRLLGDISTKLPFRIGTPRKSAMGTSRVSLVQLIYNLLTWVTALTSRMPETTAACAILDVENKVVTRARGRPHRDRIQS